MNEGESMKSVVWEAVENRAIEWKKAKQLIPDKKYGEKHRKEEQESSSTDLSRLVRESVLTNYVISLFVIIRHLSCLGH